METGFQCSQPDSRRTYRVAAPISRDLPIDTQTGDAAVREHVEAQVREPFGVLDLVEAGGEGAARGRGGGRLVYDAVQRIAIAIHNPMKTASIQGGE